MNYETKSINKFNQILQNISFCNRLIKQKNVWSKCKRLIAHHLNQLLFSRTYTKSTYNIYICIKKKRNVSMTYTCWFYGRRLFFPNHAKIMHWIFFSDAVLKRSVEELFCFVIFTLRHTHVFKILYTLYCTWICT